MADQIQIKWDSASGESYSASVEALQTYNPIPTIKASLRLKGRPGPDTIETIIKAAAEHGLDVSLTLTATFSSEDGVQLRLFPQPLDHAPALPDNFWEDFEKSKE